MARTSVCVDSSCGQDVCVCGLKLWPDVCVVWCRLQLWPGHLCVRTQVVARTSVCEESSCGQDVCVMRTQAVARTSVWYGVDSSCGQDICV